MLNAAEPEIEGAGSRMIQNAAAPIFKSFMHGGFECSSHRLRNGRRLDLVASTRHDEFVVADYRRLRSLGIQTAREGLRWPVIESTPSSYDFTSVGPFLEAANREGIQVIWDILHFGWPDHLDIFDPSWVDAFAELTFRFCRFWNQECGDRAAFMAPVNEISFLSWAGGDRGFFNPFA